MDLIYLDNSASTPLCGAAVEAMRDAVGVFANPASVHAAGAEASALLERARADILDCAGAGRDYRLVFCGSGSEANNLALLGTLRSGKHFPSKKVIITDSEHPSVSACAERAEKEGFETVRIPTRGGKLDTGELRRALSGGAALVSLMLVNNETGALYDVASAAAAVRELSPGTLVHCDAVQGFMREKLPFGSADMISVSAHKIGGPKGIGALFVSESVFTRKALTPVIYGGGQEYGLRSGTSNTLYSAGFAAAVRETKEQIAADPGALSRLGLYARERITAAGCRINAPEKGVPYIVSVTLPGIKSQVMLGFLSAKGICVSAGSACSSKNRRLSGSLLAFGLSPADADCTVRVSLSARNTEKEIDALAAALAEGCEKLVKIRK